MGKSGLIVGVAMLLLSLGASLISPLCALCLGLLGGLAAGYLANVFEKPLYAQGVIARGAGAGAIAGAISLIGLIAGGIINSSAMSADAINQMLGQQALTPDSLRLYQLAIYFCTSLINVALMAGLGAIGGLLYSQRLQGTQVPPPPPPSYPQA